MKVGYKSIKTILEDYADYSGEELQLQESVILKIAEDKAYGLITDEQLPQKVALIDIKDYMGTLPKGLKFIIQAGYVADKECPYTREQLIETTKQIYGTDCKLRINFECPSCHQDSCSCGTDVVVVEADQMWKDAHPEHNVAHAKHFSDYGRLNEYGQMFGYPKFNLMRRASGNFFNTPYHIPKCVNIDFDSEVEYNVEIPNIITNFKKGVVLISYFGYRTDEQGYLLIPDHPQVYDAIFYAIEEKMAWKQFRKTGETKWNALNVAARQRKNLATRAAVNALGSPDPDAFFQFLDNHWTKYIPYWEHRDRLGNFQPDTYEHPTF